MSSAEVRITLDVRLCEPGMPITGQASLCPGRECGRLGFRNVGDSPWVHCVCGQEYNANYSYVGTVP